MLTIADIATFKATVLYYGPALDGALKDQSFRAIFKYRDARAYSAMMAEVKELDAQVAAASAAGISTVDMRTGDDHMVDNTLMGWEDIRLADGKPFEYTDENRILLLGKMGMRTAIIKAYIAAQNGVREKNLGL